MHGYCELRSNLLTLVNPLGIMNYTFKTFKNVGYVIFYIYEHIFDVSSCIRLH